MASSSRKLIAKTKHEVTYFAPENRISAADARPILHRAGRSRQKANVLAEAEKQVVDRPLEP